MEVEQSVASLSPSAEEASSFGVSANGGLVDAPTDEVASDAPEEPAPEAPAALEEQPQASPKPKATVSPDAKPLRKIGGLPPKGSATTKAGSGAGAPSVKKVGIVVYLHLPHCEFWLTLS